MCLIERFRKDPSHLLALRSQQLICKTALWFLNTDLDHNIDLKTFENKKQLIIANHVSYFDILIAGSILPLSFLGKSEIKKWPLIKNLGTAAKVIYVVRDSMASRASTLFQLKRELHDRNYLLFQKERQRQTYTQQEKTGLTVSAISPLKVI